MPSRIVASATGSGEPNATLKAKNSPQGDAGQGHRDGYIPQGGPSAGLCRAECTIQARHARWGCM